MRRYHIQVNWTWGQRHFSSYEVAHAWPRALAKALYPLRTGQVGGSGTKKVVTITISCDGPAERVHIPNEVRKGSRIEMTDQRRYWPRTKREREAYIKAQKGGT